MNEAAKVPRPERLLAGLLRYGSWIATMTIGTGLALALDGRRQGMPVPAMHLVTMGIGLFILLPVLRVIMMLLVFAHARDHRSAAFAVAVLLIILLAFMLGTHGRGH